ncbi:hypothetical protein HY488_01580 [Candidatus Woesearchaeota archaeon]|nr:hypothetical protein [Candidatus Woesearchaeota archaeon]
MGIKTEYNPDLALRNVTEHKNGLRKKGECIPEHLVAGMVYEFLKQGQRNYWLEGEVPLVETKGNGQLSRPKASVIILEATHFLQNEEVWTKGRYKVVEVFDPNDARVYFDGFARTK